MTYLAFAASLLAAAILFLAGVEKLLAAGDTPDRAWVPSFVGRRLAVTAVRGVGAIEALVALVAAVPLGLGVAASVLVIALGISVTAYGLLALRNSRGCGCGVAVPDVSTPRALLIRNLVMFGALLSGTAAGPSVDTFQHDPAAYALVATLALYAAAAVGVAHRAWTQRAAPRAR